LEAIVQGEAMMGSLGVMAMPFNVVTMGFNGKGAGKLQHFPSYSQALVISMYSEL
jgi:hypothetical protein